MGLSGVVSYQRVLWNRNPLTDISLVVYMRPIADDGVICKLAKPLGTVSDLHHREIRVAFDPGLFDSQSGVPLKKLSFRDQLSEAV